jgi:hypothetical protein
MPSRSISRQEAWLPGGVRPPLRQFEPPEAEGEREPRRLLGRPWPLEGGRDAPADLDGRGEARLEGDVRRPTTRRPARCPGSSTIQKPQPCGAKWPAMRGTRHRSPPPASAFGNMRITPGRR